jgi:hypothetical protein
MQNPLIYGGIDLEGGKARHSLFPIDWFATRPDGSDLSSLIRLAQERLTVGDLHVQHCSYAPAIPAEGGNPWE